MSEPVECSILVPVFNEERYIESSLAAMQRQRCRGELEFLVVDGRSEDRSRELVETLARKDPRIRVLENPNRTVSSGLNVALRHARGQWVARMDAHTVYPDDYISLGIDRLRAGGTRWVSGPQLPRGDGPVSRTVARALASPLGRGGSRKWGDDGRATGSEFQLDTGIFAGVWSRATLLEFGGWDERWPQNEDSEMAARFLERGEQLICLPAMSAEYVPRGTLRGLWRQYRAYGRYRSRTARVHPDSMRRSHLLAPGVVLAAAASLGAPGPARRAARGGLGLYLATLSVASGRALAGGAPVTEALLLPVVIAVMHLGHGIGALEGTLRYGPPTGALARMIGLRPTVPSLAADSEPVHAPSLGLVRNPSGGAIP